ncbi:MAG: hypothetical protein COS71_03025 [Candidatus Moranbacteria bacterium CG06_land_8_20_14_3_00_40_12]|nr:MAG: hypothetical protein COS71_03025 [Candidatus Moranbacteria bacterium CG06_land_8_20_14_3_00_40_12]
MGAIQTLVWTELFPVVAVKKELIDSLWCTRIQEEQETQSSIFSSSIPVRFMGSPCQKSIVFYGQLSDTEVKMQIVSNKGNIIMGDIVSNTGSYAEKSISLDVSGLGGQGGIVELYCRAIGSIGKIKGVVIFMEAELYDWEWTELLPNTLVWQEVL